MRAVRSWQRARSCRQRPSSAARGRRDRVRHARATAVARRSSWLGPNRAAARMTTNSAAAVRWSRSSTPGPARTPGCRTGSSTGRRRWTACLPIGLTDPATDSRRSRRAERSAGGHAGLRRRARHLHRRPDPPDLPGRRHPGGAGDVQRRRGAEGDLLGRSTGCCSGSSWRLQRDQPEVAGRRGVACRWATTTSCRPTWPMTTCCWRRCWSSAGSAWPSSPPPATTPTPRHMYPAGFAPHTDGPVVAHQRRLRPGRQRRRLNPDGKTIALFSNAGAWVSCHRRGAARGQHACRPPSTARCSRRPR